MSTFSSIEVHRQNPVNDTKFFIALRPRNFGYARVTKCDHAICMIANGNKLLMTEARNWS